VTLPPAAHPPEALAPRRPRVLVVDDDPGVGRAIHNMLVRDHEVVLADCAEAALERVRNGPPFDAIVSDVGLPDRSGIELHAAIAELDPAQARVMIFMTGARSQPGAEAFFARIDNGCLEKPFRSEVLRATVNEVVARARRPTPGRDR
jgi:CheY-like chemotaxis protein